MKKRERIKAVSVAIVLLLLVGLMTVAVSAIDLGASTPAGQTITVYTFPANAPYDAQHSGPNPNNGDPYGAPYAKYDYSSNKGFTFKGSAGRDLFHVTYNGKVNGRATCVIELKPGAGKSFHVTYLTAKQGNVTWKFNLNLTLNPGDRIVGLPAPHNGNSFGHVNVYGDTTALPTTAAPTTVATTSAAPTTVAPTTVAPTTAAPTTVATTTVATTTAAPTTVAPTTVATTTAAPTTAASTTVAPTTAAPTTAAPTTVAPTTVATTTAAPTTAATTTVAPTTIAPTTAATTTVATTTVAPTTTATTTAATTTAAPTIAEPTAIATTTAALVEIEDDEIPLTSSTLTETAAQPTTASASMTTLVVADEEIPLPDTGEAFSWPTVAGVGMILVAAILAWKRHARKEQA